MDKKGTKKVKLAGLEDKRQVMAVFAATMTGDFLPPQLIYKGTTHACLPTNKFPDSLHVTYTYNHWCNEEAVKLCIEKVIVPYIQRKKDEQNCLILKELCVSLMGSGHSVQMMW